MHKEAVADQTAVQPSGMLCLALPKFGVMAFVCEFAVMAFACHASKPLSMRAGLMLHCAW